MINADTIPMGNSTRSSKAPGHWVLARLGKKVLRPGGMELTRAMLDALSINDRDAVVEFAPGLGATARLTLEQRPKSYTAIERDENAAANVRRILAQPTQQCLIGRAEETGLPEHSATVVYGEAMLSMQSESAKHQIVAEAARLLVDGGRYGIHELAIVPDELDVGAAEQIRKELTNAIHHNVRPLRLADWKALIEAHGLHVDVVRTAPMHLLEPRRLLSDEGLLGSLRFAFNLARDHESRSRVLQMRRVFRKYQQNLAAVTIVATKGVKAAATPCAEHKCACGRR